MEHITERIDQLSLAKADDPATSSHDPTVASRPDPRKDRPCQTTLDRPQPSPSYVSRANREPQSLDHSRPLLVVLDLNGTMLYRIEKGGANVFTPRPRVDEFLRYLLSSHRVMIWASARPRNVKAMCDQLFAPAQRNRLVAVWGRDKLRLPREMYGEKVQVYKQLSWVWEDLGVALTAALPDSPWDQGNTVLVDDSLDKGAAEPYNVLKIDTFEAKGSQTESDVLGQVVRYLEKLRWQKDVSTLMRSEPFTFRQDAEPFDWALLTKSMAVGSFQMPAEIPGTSRQS